MTPEPQRLTIAVTDELSIGPDSFAAMAGPCAVESRSQLLAAARGVHEAGAALLRGGAYKPRTSPKSFQGLGEQGLALLREASQETGLPVVTEVMDPRHVELAADYADILQVGSRSMQNYPLLREVGRCSLPVLLKRGASATVDEFLAATDYILNEGNEAVILCERGLRSFDPSTRYLLDLAAVPNLQGRCPLPIIVDPSHGTGRPELIMPMALAALAAGADGLLIEVHPEPAKALSDGEQALTLEQFSHLMDEIRRWISPSGRYLAAVEPPPGS